MADRFRGLIDPCERTWVLACSGGADSVYLLDQAARMAACWPARLLVVHVNHGWRGDAANRDEALVRALAMERGLALRIVDCTRNPRPSSNLQDHARRIRRTALLELAGDGTVVLLGHHACDQAETVLAALLKRKAPWGVRGMSSREGIWLRPMLDLDPRWIRDRCRRLGLAWREDESNLNCSFERNHLRHWLLAPSRNRHGRTLDRVLANMALELREMGQSRRQELEELLVKLDLQPNECGWSLEREAALRYHEALLPDALRLLGRQLELWGRDPAQGTLERAARFLGDGRTGASCPLGGKARLELGRHRAWLVIRAPRDVHVRLSPGQELSLAGGRIGWTKAPRPGLLAWQPCGHASPGSVLVRRWKPGDRLATGPDRRPLLADLMGVRGFAPTQKRLQWVVEEDGIIRWCPGLAEAWMGPARLRIDHLPIWVEPCP